MKALSILALLAASFAASTAWAGQTAVTVTQVAGPETSILELDQIVTTTLYEVDGVRYLSFELYMAAKGDS